MFWFQYMVRTWPASGSVVGIWKLSWVPAHKVTEKGPVWAPPTTLVIPVVEGTTLLGQGITVIWMSRTMVLISTPFRHSPTYTQSTAVTMLPGCGVTVMSPVAELMDTAQDAPSGWAWE